MSITFVTGNQNKLREAEAILGVKLRSQIIDLPELQFSTSDEVAQFKAQEAARRLNGPVLVDDTALHFNGIGGLPGAYIRAFVDRLTPANLARLLYGFEDKTATVTCSIGFCPGPDAPAQVFTGRVDGMIVEPRGQGGFGFDPIFQPNGYTETYAEMTSETKNAISHRALAWEAVKASGVCSS
jgi:inosine triphosphate pyrophosphatase